MPRRGEEESTVEFDIRKAWRQTEAALDAMTDAERRQTLVNAGIFTRSGKVAKAYSKVIREKKAKASS